MGKVPPRVPGRNAFPASPPASSGGVVSIVAYFNTGATIAASTTHQAVIDEVYYPGGQTTFDWQTPTFPDLVKITDVGMYWVSAWVQGTTTDDASAIGFAIERTGSPVARMDIMPVAISATGGANVTWFGSLVAPLLVSGSAQYVGISLQNYSTTGSVHFDDAVLSVIQMAPSGYGFET